MNEQLLKIEQACLEANTAPVVLTGVTLMILGLFLWIGGLRYLKAVTGFIGACIGTAIGFMISSYIDVHPAATICISATLCAFIAMLAQQVIIFILAIMIFSFAFGTGYLDYTIGKHGLTRVSDESSQTGLYDEDASSNGTGLFGSGSPFGEGSRLDELNKASQTALKAGKYANSFGQKLQEIYNELKPTVSKNAGYLIMWCVVGGIIGLVLAKLLKLIVMGFCCSVVGSSAMITGLMLAIIAKGTPVWSNLQNHHKVLTIVFGAMVAFGWLFQLMTGGMKQSKQKKESSENV